MSEPESDFPSIEARLAFAEAELRIANCGGRAVDLSIPGLDRLPTAIEDLDSIGAIELIGTQVVDLTRLSGLTSLKSVALNLTPVSDLSPISSLSDLQTLIIKKTRVSNLSPISGLTGLKLCQIDQTPVVDLSPLSGMANLRLLSISGTMVTDLSPLSNLKNLWSLTLDETPVGDLSPLTNITKLSTLSFAETLVDEISVIINFKELAQKAWQEVNGQGKLLGGLKFRKCSKLPMPLQDISQFGDDAQRTVAAINWVRRNLGLSGIEDWLDDTVAAAPQTIDHEAPEPNIPTQTEGLSYTISRSGLLTVAASGLPNDNDRTEIEDTRSVMLEALNALIEACERTNAYGPVAEAAGRYRDEVQKEISQISIDKLHAYGVWLGAAHQQTLKEIESEISPEFSVSVGGSIDTIMALHGIIVLGTERGKTLVQRAKEYDLTREQQLDYKEKARAFTEALKQTENIADVTAKRSIEIANKNIAEGKHPERATVIAETQNINFVRMLGKVIVNPATVTVGTAAFLASEPGIALQFELVNLSNASWAFMLANQAIIRDLAAATGTDLNWIQSLFRWMEQRERP